MTYLTRLKRSLLAVTIVADLFLAGCSWSDSRPETPRYIKAENRPAAEETYRRAFSDLSRNLAAWDGS